MKFSLTVDMDNAAFDPEDKGRELRRILIKVCDDIDAPTPYLINAGQDVRDVNGNRVGAWEITDRAIEPRGCPMPGACSCIGAK